MNSRRNAKRIILSVLMIGLVAIAIGSFSYYRLGATAVQITPAENRQRVSTVNGVTIITLDTAIQAQSGIRTEPLPATNHRMEVPAYGSVLDLQPLIDLRFRYMSAQADAATAEATATASRNELERKRILYQDNQNVSLKDYQTAQAAHRSAQAKQEAASTNLTNVRGVARQQFGETLERWALGPDSPLFERLLNRQEVLLRVIAPLGDDTQAPSNIQVAANSNQRLQAYLISPSPQSDPAVQGSAFIYRAVAQIAAGTNIVAYLPTSSETTPGVLIPARAIVWYGGQPWAYVLMAPDRFARRPLAQHAPLDGGFFVSEGIKAGERIVVSGAQLLLSEELRPPPGSSACKDPECD